MLSFYSGAPRRRVLPFLFLFMTILFTPLFAEETPAPDEAPASDETPAPAAAEKSDEEADVVVTATRTKDDRLRVPPFVIRLTHELLEAAGKATLPEAAAEKAGVQLYDSGYRGGLEQLWLRGATGTRVLVLLDGVPTNNALDGQMSLSLIPPEIVERMEIVQGGMSLLYGSQAVGGVINVITKKGAAADSFLAGRLMGTSYLPQEYDSAGSTVAPEAASLFDGGRASLSGGHDFGPLSFFASGVFDWERNEYCYTEAGLTSRRDNAELLCGAGIAGVSFPWPSGSVNVTGIYTRQRVGVPGSLAWLTPQAQQTDERFQALAGYHEDKFLSELLSLDVKLSLTRQYRLYEDPSAPPYDSSDLTAFFAEASQRLDAADFLSLIYGGNFSVDAVTGTSCGEHTRLSGSAFLSAPVTLEEVFRVFPAARFDLTSDYGGEVSFGLGASLLLGRAASLKLSAGKSFRAPTLNELYNVWGSNPALRPERGWHADFGFSLQAERVKLESALFTRYMQDEIQLDGMWIPQNIAESFYPGAEVQAEVEFVEHFFAELGYTFIYSFNLSGGRTLESNVRVMRVPMHQGKLYLSYRPDGLTVRLGAEVMSDRFQDEANTVLIPAHLVLNANCRWSPTKGLTVTAALDNILNTQYQLVFNYPMPGIRLRWGLEWKL